MSVRKWFVQFAAVFVVALVVSVMVTLLWNLTTHRAGAVDWETSFRLALTLGIIVPWIGMRRRDEK